MPLTKKEQIIVQKLIRHEKDAAHRLPHLDEGYIQQLDVIYNKVSNGEDHWKDFV